ncbi:MAG: hypothetical protein RIC19_05345 [Phaeodactylibacter sp.]|uniref:hypothetical protein n=1 Tax=Phaeodactylibacter sp. TaxID=1940289 RepID=UPI0032EF03C6
MKWDFFYDEGNGKPYESISEWYADIRHLIAPGILMIGLGVTAFIYFRYFHF